MRSRIYAGILAAVIGAASLSAQSSLPAPGSGGSYNAGGGIMGANGIGWNPAPAPVGAWGSPWYSQWNYGPGWNSGWNYAPVNYNQGIMKVVACGYDIQGIWRVLPLLVSYQYDGVQYDVNVLNAWNPWTDSWNVGVDAPAYNTTYYLRGNTYNYYTVLSTGTYYFNL